MTCEFCEDKPKKCNKDFTRTVVEIDNPEQITLIRKVTVPASMGDDTTMPPVVGKYHNVLLYYEANQKSYLYSSDGIPTLLANGLTDYEQAVNLPQINGVTLMGDKASAELGLQSALTAGDGIEIENDTLSISNIEQYAHFFDTVADMHNSTNLSDGDFAKTCGYLRRGDGVYNIYKIRQKTVADSVDGYNIVDVSNGGTLIAERIQYGNKLFIELLPTDNIQDYLDIVAEKTIVIPSSGITTTSNNIYVNSDTTIDLNNAAIVGKKILLYRLDDTFTGYSGNKNIKIINGTLDNSEIICMHNKNVLVENIIFAGNANDRHSMQIAGCYGFTIRNCEFNGTNPANEHGSECINIDPCNYGAQPWMPQDSPMYDHTRNRNILVESNVFHTATVTGLRYTNAVGSHGRDDSGQTICEGLIIRENDFGSPYHSAVNMCDYIDVVIENNIAAFDTDNMSTTSSFIVARNNQKNIVIENNNSTGSVQFASFEDNSSTTDRTGIYLSNNIFQTNDNVNESSLFFYRVHNLHLSGNDADVTQCFARIAGDASTVESGQRSTYIWIEKNTIRHPGTGGSNIIRCRFADNIDIDSNVFKFNTPLDANACIGFVYDEEPQVSVTNNLANPEISRFSGHIELGGFRNNDVLYTLGSGFDSSSLSVSGDLNHPITYYRTIVLMMGTSSNMRLVELKPWITNGENFDTDNRTWRIPVLNNDNTTGYATFSITDSGTKYTYSGSIPIRALLGKD